MNIQNLSNSELEQSLLKLTINEKKLLHLILLHIAEVDARRLYLEKGRSSLFEYLITDLGYSGSSAQRRIEGARLIRQLPVVADKIKGGTLQLSQVGEFVRAVKQKEHETHSKVSPSAKLVILTAIECRTKFETQRILASSLDLNLKSPETKTVQKDESVHIALTLSKTAFAKLESCRDRASHKLLREFKGSDLAGLIEVLADIYLEKFGVSEKVGPLKTATAAAAVNDKLKKMITAKTRSDIRNLHQHCQHRDFRSGRICGSRFLLEVDHKIPRWAGGTNEFSNLTLLCSAHNKAKYRREVGLR